MRNSRNVGQENDAASAALASALSAIPNLNDTMLQLITGLKTRDGARLLGADPRAVTLAAAGAGNPGSPGMVAGASAGVLVGVNVRETGGAVTTIRVVDSADPNGAGNLLWGTTLTANTERTVWFHEGISFTAGLYVQVSSGGAGAVEAVVYQKGGSR